MLVGFAKKVKNKIYYSRVDIELINEQVKLFYSNLDEVEISFTEDKFILTEYVLLGLNGHNKYYPLEQVNISFEENGSYKIDTELLFKAPQLDKRSLMHLLNNNNFLLEKLKTQKPLHKKKRANCLIFVQYICCVFLMKSPMQ